MILGNERGSTKLSPTKSSARLSALPSKVARRHTQWCSCFTREHCAFKTLLALRSKISWKMDWTNKVAPLCTSMPRNLLRDWWFSIKQSLTLYMHTSSMWKPKTMMPCSHQLLETIQLVITHAGFSDSLRTKVSMCRAMTSVLPKLLIIIINRGMSLQLSSFWVTHLWNPPKDTSNPIKTKWFRSRKTIFWNKTKKCEDSSDW